MKTILAVLAVLNVLLVAGTLCLAVQASGQGRQISQLRGANRDLALRLERGEKAGEEWAQANKGSFLLAGASVQQLQNTLYAVETWASAHGQSDLAYTLGRSRDDLRAAVLDIKTSIDRD
jgi:hypothetical protein